MPGEIFYWIFNMSLVASLSGIALLLLRKIRAIPKRVICFLWVIPFLRFTVPIGISGKFSLMSLISRFAAKEVVVLEASKNVSVSCMNMVQAADSYFPVTYKVNVLEKVFFVAFIVWVCVTTALFIAYFATYGTALKSVSDARPLPEGLFVSEKVDSPAVYGIFRPKIIIPEKLIHSDKKYILMHEKAHIKGRDNLKRLIAFCVVFFHWFNPFSWIFLRYYLEDLELSCDERVISKCSDNEKKNYARALVAFSDKKSYFASAFGGARIKKRISHILSYKKVTLLSAVCLCVMIFAVMYLLLTNAG